MNSRGGTSERRDSVAAYTAEDQWHGLYAGRPEDQKMVNAEALATLIEERNALAAEVVRLSRLADHWKHNATEWERLARKEAKSDAR